MICDRLVLGAMVICMEFLHVARISKFAITSRRWMP